MEHTDCVKDILIAFMRDISKLNDSTSAKNSYSWI